MRNQPLTISPILLYPSFYSCSVYLLNPAFYRIKCVLFISVLCGRRQGPSLKNEVPGSPCSRALDLEIDIYYYLSHKGDAVRPRTILLPLTVDFLRADINVAASCININIHPYSKNSY